MEPTSKEKIFEIIVAHSREVIPELGTHRFEWHDRLKDLGADSTDRADIVMMALESLSLQIPLVTVAKANSIGELAEILYDKLQGS